ncbi:MAG: sulfatase-like hydrolase/transferase, partial [Myxococcota bacterium]|nr:sulfatase-like hydrolase/transferase [Myxococcota bacterium]
MRGVQRVISWRLLASLVWACGCGGDPEPRAVPVEPPQGVALTEKRTEAPNLVLVTVDTLRSDHLGYQGYAAADTPNLDRLASESVRFTRASTVSNNTLPAHVAMLTGRSPQASGVPRNGYKLSPKVPTLAEQLGESGYRTAAFVSASALSGKLGLARGFDLYDESFPVKEMDQRQRRAVTTVAAARAWL